MTTRGELIRLFVLNAACDDYEELHQIFEDVHEVAVRCGMPVGLDDVRKAILELFQQGWMDAYVLSAREPAQRYSGEMTEDDVDQYYFFISESGRVSTGRRDGGRLRKTIR